MEPHETDPTHKVLLDVWEERRRQDARYDNSATPLGFGPSTCWLLPYTTDTASTIEGELRVDYMEYEDEAPVTWLHLIREEVAEAFAESDPELLRAELLQVAALCVSAVEKMDAGTIPEIQHAE